VKVIEMMMMCDDMYARATLSKQASKASNKGKSV
jgi:hypothetical protein